MFALVAWASNNRPVLIALAIVFLCGWLLRPKAPRTGQDVAAPVAARAAVATPKKRAVSISTAGILLRLGGGAPEIDDSALTALLALCAIADIHLVTQLETDSDAQEAAVMAAFETAGVFGEGACDRRKVICCATEDGRAAIIRQLAPALHLDTSSKVAQYLAPHLPSVVLVGGSSSADAPPQGRVRCCSSLAEYASEALG